MKFNLRFGFMLFLVLLSPSLSYGSQNPAAEQFIVEGAAQARVKNYDQAILLFSKAIESQPDNPQAFLNRGIAHHLKGDTQESISDLSRAVELQPTAVAHYNLGEAYLAGKNFQEAVASFSRSLQMEPKNGFALLERGVAYLELGEFKEAFQDFDQIIQSIAKIQNAYFYRGLAQYKMGSIQAATRDFTTAIDLGEHDAPAGTALAFMYRGTARIDAKNFTEASKDLEAALGLDPSLVSEIKPLLNRIKSARASQKQRKRN